MNQSEFLIYQNPEGGVKIEVRLEDETVWLTQELMAELFGKSKKTVSEHIRNIFFEGELDEKVVVRNFRKTSRHGAIPDKTQTMKDWINRLDAILKLNGRELLTHAGKISHQKALDKSEKEFQKFKEIQKENSYQENLKELEEDLKGLLPSPKKGKKNKSGEEK